MDTNLQNYLGGLVLDSSIAITKPYYLLDTRPLYQVIRYKREDLLLSDRMIREANIDAWERATPNYLSKKKLRHPRLKSKDS